MTSPTPDLIAHLFRHEAGKLVSYLTRTFGLSRLDLSEDVVQDSLCRALELWPIQGIPDNPTAWLVRVARNRYIDLLRRDEYFRAMEPELAHSLKLREETNPQLPGLEKQIEDDQLRMMLACCHPDLSTDAQLTLILKTLCGFSVSEIAHALLVSEDSVEKRLTRARKLFRTSASALDANYGSVDPARLDAVYSAIYLLFNEGYHSTHGDQTVRDDLCYEAMRLALLLNEHVEIEKSKSNALLALFCFHAARLTGRVRDDGVLIQLEMQDRSKWDQALIARGFDYLQKSATGTEMTEYHAEAAIASVHCAAPSYSETNWSRILELYDLLYRLKPSPVVALNRAIAVGKTSGPAAGLAAIYQIPDVVKLKDYPFYPAAQGEFLLQEGKRAEAARYFREAMAVARTAAEEMFFEAKARNCEAGLSKI